MSELANKRFLVIRAHDESYADPIAVAAGDVLNLSGESDLWEGHRWLWATGPDGRQGWVPDSLIRQEGALGVALRDYSALELTCRPGDVLIGLLSTHGWLWCRDHDGQEGWVPMSNLSTHDPQAA